MKWGIGDLKPTILIVEDEPPIATLIQYNVEQAGFLTDVANDGIVAIRKAKQRTYDFIILDIMLPKMDGMEVCKVIREHDRFIPILMLTARDDEHHRIKGLNIGADDYITKPFSPKELVARIHAILRRTKRQQVENTNVYSIGSIIIYADKYEAFIHEQQLELTRKEFELLAYFVKNKGDILSREQLLSAVWNYDFVGDTRIVDVHVARLREKIEMDTKNPKYIKTVRGFGYKMEEPI